MSATDSTTAPLRAVAPAESGYDRGYRDGYRDAMTDFADGRSLYRTVPEVPQQWWMPQPLPYQVWCAA